MENGGVRAHASEHEMKFPRLFLICIKVSVLWTMRSRVMRTIFYICRKNMVYLSYELVSTEQKAADWVNNEMDQWLNVVLGGAFSMIRVPKLTRDMYFDICYKWGQDIKSNLETNCMKNVKTWCKLMPRNSCGGVYMDELPEDVRPTVNNVTSPGEADISKFDVSNINKLTITRAKDGRLFIMEPGTHFHTYHSNMYFFMCIKYDRPTPPCMYDRYLPVGEDYKRYTRYYTGTTYKASGNGFPSPISNLGPDFMFFDWMQELYERRLAIYTDSGLMPEHELDPYWLRDEQTTGLSRPIGTCSSKYGNFDVNCLKMDVFGRVALVDSRTDDEVYASPPTSRITEYVPFWNHGLFDGKMFSDDITNAVLSDPEYAYLGNTENFLVIVVEAEEASLTFPLGTHNFVPAPFEKIVPDKYYAGVHNSYLFRDAWVCHYHSCPEECIENACDGEVSEKWMYAEAVRRKNRAHGDIVDADDRVMARQQIWGLRHFTHTFNVRSSLGKDLPLSDEWAEASYDEISITRQRQRLIRDALDVFPAGCDRLKRFRPFDVRDHDWDD